ncbi:MAG TPA: CHAT domain-containing protein, partial [Chryseosolibacter sp.]|nr:CHAT domain-containing protein [Chryseosolibacter sp.]
PDGILNFLPFEALIGDDGKYLVEQFDVRYVQSAQVKKLIENRSYGARPKELLAMGGATYEPMNVSAARVSNADELVMLRNVAHENTMGNRSQRKIYASLGFRKLDYLPGTLEEVNAISKMFPNSSSLITGGEMTEPFVKSISRSNELAKYRIVHLATHGFAIPEVPELSGIAMCIPSTEQGGEDGYLTSPEIAKLGLRADLVVLSACETALGKVYGGEGVAGLTQALLVGGANRAIVSLWPVNDLGTMHFMKGFYSLVKNEGKDFDEAINIMKRKFIRGDFGPELRHPDIWAPFIHYGK